MRLESTIIINHQRSSHVARECRVLASSPSMTRAGPLFACLIVED